jgi:hypothetical protein
MDTSVGRTAALRLTAIRVKTQLAGSRLSGPCGVSRHELVGSVDGVDEPAECRDVLAQGLAAGAG